MPLTIMPAYDDIPEIVKLFQEYTGMLGINLDFQKYDEELTQLPGRYAPPLGRLYLARFDSRPAGCIALRPFDATACEMKRLFVRPEFRGNGIGQMLIEKILEDAREIGYRSILLDTLTTLDRSIAIYERLGFGEIEPYYHNPHPDALYFRLDLRQGS